MNRLSLLLLSLLWVLLPTVSFSQSYIQTYVTSQGVTGGHMAHDSVCGVVALCGNRTDSLGGYDILLTLAHEDGSLIFSRNLDPTGLREEAHDVWVDVSAQVYVAGRHTVSLSQDGLIANVDTNGMVDWAYLLGASGSAELFQGLDGYTDSAGVKRLALAGSTYGTSVGATEDAWLVGSPMSFPDITWNTVYAGPGDDRWNAVAFTSSHQLVVTGYTLPPGGDKDLLIGCYSSGGTLAWLKSFSDMGDDEGLAITEQDGKVYVAGYTSTPTFPEASAFVMRLDLASGNLEETTLQLGGLGGMSVDYVATGVEVSQEGDLIVTGYRKGMQQGEFITRLDTASLDALVQRVLQPNGRLMGSAMLPSGEWLAGGLYLDTLPTGEGDLELWRLDNSFNSSFACTDSLWGPWAGTSLSLASVPDSSYALTTTEVFWNLNPAVDSASVMSPCVPLSALPGAPALSLHCGPQPAHDLLAVHLPTLASPASLSLLRLDGRAALPPVQISAAELSQQLDVSTLPSGIYLLSLEGEGVRVSRKVTVVH